MAFLKVSNWTVPVTVLERPTRPRDEIGVGGASQASGTWRDGVRGHADRWRMRTALVDQTIGETLEWLLRGRGYHFPFDGDLLSARSRLSPNSPHPAQLGTVAPTPKYGGRRMNVTSSGGTVSWTMDLIRTGTWAASWWHNYNNTVPAANSWDHWAIIANDGFYTSFKNGVSQASGASPPTNPGNYSASEANGRLTFGLLGKQTDGTNTTAAFFDDLVLVPFFYGNGTGSLLDAIYTSTVAFSDLPFLRASGTAFEEADSLNATGKEMRGFVENVENLTAGGDSGFLASNREITFSLRERVAK